MAVQCKADFKSCTISPEQEQREVNKNINKKVKLEKSLLDNIDKFLLKNCTILVFIF